MYNWNYRIAIIWIICTEDSVTTYPTQQYSHSGHVCVKILTLYLTKHSFIQCNMECLVKMTGTESVPQNLGTVYNSYDIMSL